jgi:hypothetical protein
MKKMLFSLFVAGAVNAQAQTLPRVKKIPVQKAPGSQHIKLPSNPDMLVSNLRLLSVTKDETANTYNLRISYTIKNNGERSTEETAEGRGFHMMCYINRGVVMPMYLPHNGIMKPGVPPEPWQFAAETLVIHEAVPGKSSLHNEQEFTIPITSENAGKKFYLVMGADTWNTTKETDNHNNYSNIILVAPPVD